MIYGELKGQSETVQPGLGVEPVAPRWRISKNQPIIKHLKEINFLVSNDVIHHVRYGNDKRVRCMRHI